jgi:hypothetical protein
MALASMRFDRRKWRPFRDDIGIVHHATRVTRKEAEYLFRLAVTIRTLVGCLRCLAVKGVACRRRDGQPMANHSERVDSARSLVKDKYEPLYDRMCLPLCVADTDNKYVVFKSAPDEEVDCMACVTAATSR